MVIFDTNVFIYLANGNLPGSIVSDVQVGYASITRIEALGYHRIEIGELALLEELFDSWQQLELDGAVIERATSLRQRSKIGLGDAIVAATALVYSCPLWTANVDDFASIEGLLTVNPLQPDA